jgi:hypothetical protein
MALSILSTPSDTSSVSNEMLFVINEATKANDDVTYPNYKYILDLYVDGVLVQRFRANPDPVNRLGVFDVSRVLQAYVPEYQLSVLSDIVDYDVMLSYTVKLGEEYSDTQYLSLVTDSERTCFRTYKQRPYSSTGMVTNGLASNMPPIVTTQAEPGDTVPYQLIPYFSNVSGVTDLTATYYNSAGVVLNSATYDNTDFVANKIRQYNIENDTAAYCILTGPFTLRINYECTKYPVFTLAWLNPFGGYESQTFSKVSKKNIEVNRKSYQQLDYKINASGVVSYADNNVFYGRKKDYNSHVKTRIQLKSHLLNASEYTWLADLFISPQVYLYITTAQTAGSLPVPVPVSWVPVHITANNYEYRTYLNSKLTQLEFEIELSNDFNSQFL